jgi:hypothetical protein
MTPEQFLEQLREKVREDLPKWMEYTRRTLPQNPGPDETKAWVQELQDRGAERMVQAGFISRDRVDKVSRVMVAVSKSKRLGDYMRRATSEILRDRRYVDISQRMIREPDTITAEDVEYMTQRSTSDDRLISGVYRAAFSDPKIREAIGIPPDITAERMMVVLRRQIKERNSLEDLAQDPELHDLFTVPVVPVVVIATVLALAHTFIVAYTQAAATVNLVALLSIWAAAFVSVVASGIDSSGWVGALEGPNGPLCSAVHNDSSKFAWVVFRDRLGLKRVALAPGTSSLNFGLMTVEAILLGGPLNELKAMEIGRGQLRKGGAYVLVQDPVSPGEVRLQDRDTGVAVMPNQRQREAEEQGIAGYSDLAGGGSAGRNYDRRLRMEQVTSVAPPRFDYRQAQDYQMAVQTFYDRLRITAALESVTRKFC